MKLSERTCVRRPATRKQAVALVSQLQETLLEAANLATMIELNGHLPHVRELLDLDLDFMVQVNLLSKALELDTGK